jgi:hypothetical protein
VDLADALEVLGIEPGTPMAEVRVAYRTRVRAAHPDLASAGERSAATARTALITDAFATVRRAVLASDDERVPRPPPPAPPPEPERRAPWTFDALEADADGDTIAIAAPAPEAYAALLEAGSRIGGIGYVDRRLGILELIVRFEGGPSCSVLITLQGRAFGTDAFVTMESIEADPTPPLRPVVEALVEELRRPT